jgi:hypothetical protein
MRCAALAVLAALVVAGSGCGAGGHARAYVVSAQRACTLYVSPHGTASGPGRSPAHPLSLDAAIRRTLPGTVVCLLPGVYNRGGEAFVTRSGVPGRPVTYRSHGGRAVLRWAARGGAGLALVKLDHGVHDIAISDLTLDGSNRASQGVKCSSGDHHLLVSGNTILDTGSAGVATKRCDYVAVIRNRIYHTGYDPRAGWSSGVSLNTPVWHDRAPGFHSFVVGNVISGADDESVHHSEGHGVILDLGGSAPPALVADNVVYENGSRCINVLRVSGAWVVNNTCYADGLDLRQHGVAEITASGGAVSKLHLLNNVAYAWTGRTPFQLLDGAHATLRGNVEFGGVASRPSAGLRRADPLFAAPPPVDPSAAGQQARAVPPWRLGAALMPRPGSPLVDAGVNPLADPDLTPALRRGMRRYLLRDLEGTRRPQGHRWDVGAYELRQR